MWSDSTYIVGLECIRLVASLIFECVRSIGGKEDAKFKITDHFFLNGKVKINDLP